MKYLYSKEKCPNCVKLKQEFDTQGVEYEERDAARLKGVDDRDAIDLDALVQLAIQNNVLPVVVER